MCLNKIAIERSSKIVYNLESNAYWVWSNRLITRKCSEDRKFMSLQNHLSSYTKHFLNDDAR